MKKLFILLVLIILHISFASSQQNPPQWPKKALYVIDGIPTARREIQNMDSKEIVEIIVLKNKASSALYGKKGKKGSILITTRKGAITIYHRNFSSISTEYSKKLKVISNENDIIYIIDDKPIKEDYEIVLMKLKRDQIKGIKLIDSNLTRLNFGIESKEGAVLITTK